MHLILLQCISCQLIRVIHPFEHTCYFSWPVMQYISRHRSHDDTAVIMQSSPSFSSWQFSCLEMTSRDWILVLRVLCMKLLLNSHYGFLMDNPSFLDCEHSVRTLDKLHDYEKQVMRTQCSRFWDYSEYYGHVSHSILCLSVLLRRVMNHDWNRKSKIKLKAWSKSMSVRGNFNWIPSEFGERILSWHLSRPHLHPFLLLIQSDQREGTRGEHGYYNNWGIFCAQFLTLYLVLRSSSSSFFVQQF